MTTTPTQQPARCGFCGRTGPLVDDGELCIRCDLLLFPGFLESA